VLTSQAVVLQPRQTPARERTGCESNCEAFVSWTNIPPGARTRATSA